MGVRGLHVLRLIIDIIANIETEVNVRALNTYVDKSSCPLHSSLGYSKEAKRQRERELENSKRFDQFWAERLLLCGLRADSLASPLRAHCG